MCMLIVIAEPQVVRWRTLRRMGLTRAATGGQAMNRIYSTKTDLINL